MTLSVGNHEAVLEPGTRVRAEAAPEQIQFAASMEKLHHAIRQAFAATDQGQQKSCRCVQGRCGRT